MFQKVDYMPGNPFILELKCACQNTLLLMENGNVPGNLVPGFTPSGGLNKMLFFGLFIQFQLWNPIALYKRRKMSAYTILETLTDPRYSKLSSSSRFKMENNLLSENFKFLIEFFNN